MSNPLTLTFPKLLRVDIVESEDCKTIAVGRKKTKKEIVI